MGFSWFLITACVVCGLAWWSGHRYPRYRPMPVWVDLSRTVFVVFLFLLLVRSFVVEPYRVPSASMMPTLQSGDYIVVQKFCYGLRLPIINTSIMPTDLPQRGDVVAFRKPGDESRHFVKRVVALPGDRVFYRNKVLRINGEPVGLEFLQSATSEQANSGFIEAIETIDGTRHRIIHQRYSDNGQQEFEKTIPKAHYFVMGDNRDDSQDSRDPEVGLVPYSHLVGKVSSVWMNWHDFSRSGTKIQ